MNLGKNISKYRKKQNLSQEELAEMLKVSRQTISNWELNETMPSSEQVVLLTKIFKITADELLGIDTKNVLIEKMSGTEKMVKNQFKVVKLLLVIFYFLILFILIGFIIYFVTLKDYTSDYQEYANCNINNKSIRLFITPGVYNKYDEEKEEYVIVNDNIWRLHIEERDQNNNITMPDIGLSAGYSYKEALDSLNYLKKRIIEKGGTCS